MTTHSFRLVFLVRLVILTIKIHLSYLEFYCEGCYYMETITILFYSENYINLQIFVTFDYIDI